MDGSTDNIYVAVVDDDESICRSLARLLRVSGMQAITYGSAEKFLKDAKRPRFDCLLLDLQLPGMSGIELKKHLTQTGSTVPVIFITAHDDPDAKASAEALGCEGYFHKTSIGSEILDAIRHAVDQQATSAAVIDSGAKPTPPQKNPSA
jgi:FixJ family two-component response regulator